MRKIPRKFTSLFNGTNKFQFLYSVLRCTKYPPDVARVGQWNTLRVFTSIVFSAGLVHVPNDFTYPSARFHPGVLSDCEMESSP